MKRVLINIIIVISLLVQFLTVFAEGDNIIHFSDETAVLPETVGGEWSIRERVPKTYEDNDFSKNSGRLGVVYGTWSVTGGKYIQNGLSVGAAARTLLPESFADFTMKFDVTPLSDDTKLMLFFGCTSLYEVCVGEITSDGSNIIIGEKEYKGDGHIEKNTNYKVRLESKDGNLKLYLNDDLINEQTGLLIPAGQVGFGCWNSKAEFDNFKVTAPDVLGSGKKLIQESKEKSIAFMNYDSQKGNFTAKMSADTFADGECGIVVFGNRNGNGYYLGVNKSKAVIKIENNGIMKTLAEMDYKAQSEKYYNYTAEVKGNEVIFKINSVEILKIKDTVISEGQFGVYSKNTGICCEYMGFNVSDSIYSDEAILDFEIKSFSDMEKGYEEACGVVNGLRIVGGFSDGTFRGGSGFTRGEFAEAMYKIQGLIPQMNGYDFKIFDVREDYMFKASVYSAVKDGYLNLIDGKVRPEEVINREDAIFAAVKLMGLQPLTEKRSVVSVAEQFDLLDNVRFLNGLLDRNNAAQLLLNMLECKRITPSEMEGGVMKSERTNCYLKDTFGIEKIYGTVEETEYGCAVEDRELTLKPEEILVDGKIIKTCNDCTGLLGRNIVSYAEFGEDESYGKAVWTAPNKSEIIKINASNIDSATSKNSIEYFRFEDSASTVKVKIPNSAKIIYNGQFYAVAENAQEDIFNIDNGIITLIYNNSEFKPDTIKVDSYANYVVDTVSQPNELIYDKYHKAPIYVGNKDGKTVMFKSGKKITVSDLKEFDVLSVLIPKSSYGFTVITVSDIEPVKGTLKAINNDSFTVGRDFYYFIKDIDKTKYNLSDYLTLYFDFNNTIAYIIKATGQDYAYLLRANYDSENEEVLFKMFTFENGHGNFKAAKTVNVYTSANSKIRYTQKNYNALAINADEVLDTSKVIDKNGNVIKYGVLVKYKINSDNMIYEIRFAADDTGTDIPDEKNEFSCYYDSEKSGETAYYYSGLLNSKYRINADTKILNLSGDCMEMDGFEMINSGALMWDEYYDCRLYDVNEEFKTSVMVVYDMNPGYNLPVGVVTDTKYIIDEKDNSCLELTMYKNGELITEKILDTEMVCDTQAAYWFKNEGTRAKDIKAGDLIIYQTNAEGYIKNFKLIFKNKKQDFYTTSPRGWYWGTIPSTNMTLAYTDITKKVGDVYVFDRNNYSRPVVKNSALYYICERNKVIPASFEDVKAGDNTVMIWKTAELNTVVIYR